LVQELQQVLENNPFTGEPVIQELKNNEGHPVIHQNAHMWLSRAAQATVALLASPFKCRSLSKPSGKSLSVSSVTIKYLISLLMMNPMVMVKAPHPPLIQRKILLSVMNNQMFIMKAPIL
jgi:hypothetical protein